MTVSSWTSTNQWKALLPTFWLDFICRGHRPRGSMRRSGVFRLARENHGTFAQHRAVEHEVEDVTGKPEAEIVTVRCRQGEVEPEASASRSSEMSGELLTFIIPANIAAMSARIS